MPAKNLQYASAVRGYVIQTGLAHEGQVIPARVPYEVNVPKLLHLSNQPRPQVLFTVPPYGSAVELFDPGAQFIVERVSALVFWLEHVIPSW